MKYRTNAVDFRLNSFGISLIFTREKTIFFEIQCCSTSSAKISSKFTEKVPFLADLSVTKGGILRANLKNLLFARNRGLGFTGKS